ncbi:MAG: homoserine O-acetyltransferase [Desulfomonile tiedjei]|uniref:Homoserine O-acetyltransferase n=1 Tax=Desulfomonile tiedjei TaxID=2358 RepID=A0A9D6V1A4_9BACT|nr:homoserine O-acetyltransferase [Desulfomonile tiedjei]
MAFEPMKEYADSDGSYGHVSTQFADFEGIVLESGVFLGPLRVAYETYGTLSPGKDNAVLILHALSGDAHAAGLDADGRAGWWDAMIGPGKGIDTDKYFVISSNCLGGCKGTTGPPSICEATGKPYGRSFPLITIGDMVNVQAMLVKELGIEKLHNVIGGSMGGMQALEWAVRHPDMVRSAVVIAATGRLSPQGIAFNWVGRNAIYCDPASACNDSSPGYDYQRVGKGLAVARMIGHITYLSEETMEAKFGRKLRLKDMNGYSYSLGENGKEDGEFEVESYLQHQGSSFMRRFDEDSYIMITKAIDYFDLAGPDGDLTPVFRNIEAKMLVLSFSSDWLYPTSMSLAIVRALQAEKKHVSFVELDLPYGHDSFLVNAGIPMLTRIIRGFLEGV